MSDHEETWLGLQNRAKPLIRAGILLGLGSGGFFDGIVFHQILQWHHMVSAHADPGIAGNLQLNVLADGLFHAATYIFTVLGISLLWRAWKTPTVPPLRPYTIRLCHSRLGLFNLVEESSTTIFSVSITSGRTVPVPYSCGMRHFWRGE